MRVFAVLVCAVMLLVLGSAPGRADKRVALVIGNGDYKSLRKLSNPPNDARDLARMLEGMGFDVDLGVNLGLAEMQEKITAFARRAQTADVALAFFAGHGVQTPDPVGASRPANYLLPIDADVKDALDLRLVPTARDIVAQLQLTPGVRILILDSCRDNPIPQRLASGRGGAVPRGLAAPPRTAGTLIAFSTQPDATADDGVGRNSPFVAALLKHISEPDLDVRLLFTDVRADVIRASGGNQTPETWDSLNGRFAFKSAAILAPDPVLADPCGNATINASLPPHCAKPLSATAERGLQPKDSFRECANCPEMVVVSAGSFTMGSPENEMGRNKNEEPQHRVSIARPFAVGRFTVTFDEWDACVAAGGCNGYKPSDSDWGRGRRPVINASWDDAKAYVAWLAHTTGKTYRLLSEAEREYVTRAGTTTPFWWGASITTNQANYDGASKSIGFTKGEYREQTLPVDSFQPNPWGLYQVHGNVWEWTEDCWHDSYSGAPTDGSAWTTGDCRLRAVRGSSWLDSPRYIRAAYRGGSTSDSRYNYLGFRVGRTLIP